MDLERSELINRTEVDIQGAMFNVEIFSRASGKCHALTRYGLDDVIITDGKDAVDALKKHVVVLPLAIGCRNNKEPGASEIHH